VLPKFQPVIDEFPTFPIFSGLLGRKRRSITRVRKSMRWSRRCCTFKPGASIVQ